MKLPFTYLVFVLLQIPGWLAAQNRVSKQLAEPFSISISIPENSLLPEKGSTFGPFEILEVQPQQPNKSNRVVQLQMVAYDTGRFRLSEVMPEWIRDTSYLVYIAPPEENTLREYGQPIEITIPEEDTNQALPWWLIIGAGAVLAVVVLYFFTRRKKAGIIPSAQPNEHAADILEKLKNQWKQDAISSTELGEKLVHALHVHFRVSSKTTIGALYKAINRQVQELDKEEVKKCLRLSDAWRFGKQQAGKTTGDQTIESIKKIISHPNAGVNHHTHV